jgi:hypothetical protein
MLGELRDMKPVNMLERFDRKLVQGFIGAKYKLGLSRYDDLASELHKPKKKFPRRKVVANSVDDIWAIDLVDISNLPQFKDNKKYRFNVIKILVSTHFVYPF